MSLIARLRRHVALRLTAAVGLGLAAVTLAIGAHVVISEQRELQTAVTAETLLLTRSVQIAFENAIRDRQLQDIDAMLVELEAIDPGTDIYLLGAGGTIVARSQGAGPAPSVATDGSVHFIDLADGGQTAAMHVKLGKSSYGYEGLIVARPLHAMLEDLRHTRLRVLLTVIASIAASTVLLLMVFRRSVEEPLARMTRAMRRFRQDGVPELQAPFADDEVGSALSEFAVLAHDLHEARGRIERQQ
ncbi:MAG TPA: hypothetical protein VHM19_18375, partial [Polyangiales bacterium]|nr:hypothetical protein [Polyangiales bacterium]